jgi:quinol monooxygenase YgiN
MTIFVHAQIHGLAGRGAELREVLVEHATVTAAMEGSLGSVAYAPLGGEAGEYVLDAWWRDESALRAHYGSAAYGRYVEIVGELLARPSDVQIHYVERTVRPTPDASLDPARQG